MTDALLFAALFGAACAGGASAVCFYFQCKREQEQVTYLRAELALALGREPPVKSGLPVPMPGRGPR